jgi:hypothetical protein
MLLGTGAIQHTTLYRLSIRYQYAEMISQWPKSFGTLRYAAECLPSRYIFEVEVKLRVYFGSKFELSCHQCPNRIETLSDVQQNSSDSYHQDQHMASIDVTERLEYLTEVQQTSHQSGLWDVFPNLERRTC